MMKYERIMFHFLLVVRIINQYVGEHASHVRDAGRVKAQWLVERRRALPSRKGGMGKGATCGPGGVGAGAAQAARRQVPSGAR